jgi:hypothetical protein
MSSKRLKSYFVQRAYVLFSFSILPFVLPAPAETLPTLVAASRLTDNVADACIVV